MGSVSGASVAIGARPSQQHHNMVMRATVVVFTIVLIIAGVFASEIAKEQNGELAEDDILQLSHSLQETQSNLDDLEDLNVHVKRDAVADQKKKIKKRRKGKEKMEKLQEKEIRKRRLENPNLKEKAKLERGKGNLRSSKKVRNHPQRKRKRMAIENQRNLKVRNQENQRKRKQKNKEK